MQLDANIFFSRFNLARWLLPVFLVLAPLAAQPVYAEVIGDRLVVAVNQVPYSQRQLELYFAIRAGMRAANDQQGMYVDAANWSQSLALFTDDMTILQEAQRLGSFGAADQLLDKHLAQLQTQRRSPGVFSATLKRLGGDDQTIAHTLESVLRVAAFRRSKNRQEAQSLPAPSATAAPATTATGPARWLTELTARSSTRVYSGANAYLEIAPVQRRANDGL